jgi:hypothetical protein
VQCFPALTICMVHSRMRAFEKYLFECVGECVVLAKQLRIRLEWNANTKIFLVVHSHSHSLAKQALNI